VEVGFGQPLRLNGGFTPKRLPKSEKAPIELGVSGKVEASDGGHPMVLRELIVEADRNAEFDSQGLPVCAAGKLWRMDTPHAEATCSSAKVGSGRGEVEIEYPGQPPFIAKSKLLAFNGGTSGGKTTIFVHAYLTAPVSAAVVTTVKISKIDNGRYGLKSIATIPEIADDYGSTVNFVLRIGRTFSSQGEKRDYLQARCRDGHLDGQGTGVFADGSRVVEHIARTCAPRA
jgi:hypothetical protein